MQAAHGPRVLERAPDDDYVGWRHIPVRGRDVLRFALAWAILTPIAIAIGALIVHVFADGWLGEVDLDVARWFADQRTHDVNDLAQIGAGLADAYVVTPGVIVAAVLLIVIFRRWNEAVFLLTALLLEKAVFVTTTYIVDRDRPPVGQLDGAPPTSSYPSGHVAAAVVCYGVLAIIIWSHTRRRWLRALVVVVAVLAVVAVSISRMILGMHYITDVTIGAVLGVVCIFVGASLARRTIVDLHARCHLDRRTEEEQPAAERDRDDREPRGPEAQAGDDIAEPVHSQQHP
jgi:membrane-associated phospholipid phosphatase